MPNNKKPSTPNLVSRQRGFNADTVEARLAARKKAAQSSTQQQKKKK
jgi:Zn-dependent protease with chaperone function